MVTNAVRVAAASAGGMSAVYLNHNSVIWAEKLVNSQFSQRQEAEADDYSYDLLRQRGISPAGLATSFEKLAKLEEGRPKLKCLTTILHPPNAPSIFAIV